MTPLTYVLDYASKFEFIKYEGLFVHSQGLCGLSTVHKKAFQRLTVELQNKTLQEIPQLDGERIQPYPILAYTKKPKNQYAAEIVLTQSEDPFSTLQAGNHSGSSTPGIAIEVNDF